MISRTQMLWILALLPAVLISVLQFGIHALRILSLCVAVSVIFDVIVNLLVPSKDFTRNWSSASLGVLFALLLPYDAPWWLVVVGCFIMIVIAKKLFGGLGAYPVHPVLLSYAMLMVSWPGRFDYTAAMANLGWKVNMIEPMRLVKTLGSTAESSFTWQNLLFGKQVAGIGNALVLYLLLGGIFLLAIRQITWHIPVGFLAGTFVFGWILHLVNPVQFATPMFQLLAGSTVYGAFFLATDHTTSPVNRLPMLLYGLLGGFILVLIRSFSAYSDGIVFTILLMNLCMPLLDRITPKVYGVEVIKNA